MKADHELETETFPEKDRAVRAAMGVAGVTAVADEIVVKHDGGPRGDAAIAHEAAQVIDRLYIPAGSVQATVHEQVITLSGTLVWEYQREIERRAMAVLAERCRRWPSVARPATWSGRRRASPTSTTC